MTAISKPFTVKLTLGFQDTGLEPICAQLMAQPTSFSRTRLFKELVLQAWSGALRPYPAPTAEEERFWITHSKRMVLAFYVRADGPARALFDHLDQLPDNRARSVALKRVLHKALYSPSTWSQENAPRDLPSPTNAPGISNSLPASSSTHVPKSGVGVTDLTPTPPAIPVAHTAPPPAVPSHIPNAAPHDTTTPPQPARRRLDVKQILAALDK